MEVEAESKIVILPCCGHASDDGIIGVFVWTWNLREEEGGVIGVIELKGFEEEMIVFLDGSGDHVTVDFFQFPHVATFLKDPYDHLCFLPISTINTIHRTLTPARDSRHCQVWGGILYVKFVPFTLKNTIYISIVIFAKESTNEKKSGSPLDNE